MLSLISIISTIPMPWSIEGLFRSALAQSLHDQPPILATIGLLYEPATTIGDCIAIVVSQRSNSSRIGLLIVCIGANSIRSPYDQPPLFATIGLLYDVATTWEDSVVIVLPQQSNNSTIGLLIVCIGANSISTFFVALCSLDFFFLL